MNPDFWPRALFGGMLWGDAAVRFVYMDEAGTSQHEPVTIVVGIIVDADKQMMLLEAAVREVIGGVPKQFRDGFVFHAKDIWGNAKYKDSWAQSDRMTLLKNMMALPRRFLMPISMGMVRRNSPPDDLPGPKKAQLDHAMAFGGCMGRADKDIRENAGPQEVATVVAEDVPEMRQFLKKTALLMKEGLPTLSPKELRPTEEEKLLGYFKQETDQRISRIRSAIHFVEKDEDPILQIADACAFGLRRYFSEQEFGADFVNAMLDMEPPLASFAGPSSYLTFRFRPSEVS